MTAPIASPFPTGLTDDFSAATLDAARWTAVNGGGIAAGRMYVNASFTTATVYSSVRSRLDTFAGRTLTFRVAALPAGNANAQIWVMDDVPAAGVDRIGFEYIGAADRMDFIGQTAGYAPVGTTTSVAAWSTVGHAYFRLQHTGTTIVWSTSADGITWITRRTLTQVPQWTTTPECRVSFEAFRNAAGTNDTLLIDDVNLLPTGSPSSSLPTTPPVPADALQKRTLDEVASWASWLQSNNAQGFVGEFGVVTKWADFGDAAQHAKWNALADAYLTYLDYARIHSAYWASGREFDSGYTIGLHTGPTAGTALSTKRSTVATIAAHPSRQGVIRSVNLAGWEHGVSINGGTATNGGPRVAAPNYVHTAADFAYVAADGVREVRLAVAWERLQPTLGAALDATALDTLAGMISGAIASNVRVLIDLHNYGRYTQADGSVLTLGGSLSAAQLSDFWTRLSAWVRADSARSAAVFAYGLMNEVHDLPGGSPSWTSASQAVLTAIRNGGDTRLILVGGYSFSSLTEWRTYHPTGWITDPATNFAYEAHHYFDTKNVGADGLPSPRAGQYQQSDGAGGRSTLTYTVELAAATPPSMLPTVRGTFSASGSNENATLLTGADTAVGDVLVAFHAIDWETASIMAAPTGTAGTWSELYPSANSDLGTNFPHLKAWGRRVTAAGAQRVTVVGTQSSDAVLVVVVLDGSTVADGTAWLDSATGGKQAGNTTTHTAPSTTLVGDRDRLLVAVASGMNSSTAAGINYTAISPVTKLREIDSAAWITLAVGTVGFSGTGSSGARGFTSSVSRYYVSAAIAIRGGIAPTPVLVDLVPVKPKVTTQAIDMISSGLTRDVTPFRQVVRLQRLTVEHEPEVAPVASQHRWQTPVVEHGMDLDGAPMRIGFSFPKIEVTNLTLTPIRLRVGALPASIEIVSITPLTDRTKRPTSQTYVRPRKNLRFLVQEVLSRRWVSWEFGLREPEIAWNVNTANEITGKVDARELADLGIDEWSHYLHVEQNGEIRCSGIILPWTPGGPEITITAAGVTRYPQGLNYQGNFTLGSPAGQNIDPLDVVRHCWAHLQTYPDGKLGVLVADTKSPVRIGEPERESNFVANAGTAQEEEVAFTSGPYLLKWWEETDIGKEIDDLAKETPFDFREAPRWNAARNDVEQWIELGYPRLGRDLGASGRAFAQGENLIEALAPVEDDERYASEVVVLGKGEGTARVRGTVTTRVGKRIRRSALVEVKNADTTTRAQSLAAADLATRHGQLEVDEVHLLATHPLAPFGSFAAGDDIPVRMTVDGYGKVVIRHRITGFTWRPEVSDMTAKTKRSDSFSYAGSEGPTTSTAAPPSVTPPTTATSAPSGIVLAAKEMLARVQSGEPYFEDFTYYGCSENLGRYNGALMDRWDRYGYPNVVPWEGPVVEFLQRVISEG